MEAEAGVQGGDQMAEVKQYGTVIEAGVPSWIIKMMEAEPSLKRLAEDAIIQSVRITATTRHALHVDVSYIPKESVAK